MGEHAGHPPVSPSPLLKINKINRQSGRSPASSAQSASADFSYQPELQFKAFAPQTHGSRPSFKAVATKQRAISCRTRLRMNSRLIAQVGSKPTAIAVASCPLKKTYRYVGHMFG